MSQTVEGGVKTKHIELLIKEIFQRRYGRSATWRPINADLILRGYSIVFSLLLEAGKGHLIFEVMRQQIRDDNLCGIHVRDLDERLWNALKADHAHDHKEHVQQHSMLSDVFHRRRWAYRPHVFTYGTELELRSSEILPLYKRRRISGQQGGAASLHQLCIPEEYLDEAMKERLEGSSFHLDSVGTCYYLAMKTFTESGRPDDRAKDLFQKECEAYRHLEKHDGMLRYLGAFSHCSSPDQPPEHNILLEYGDYDLAEYFLYNPPIMPRNVCNFWYNLFNVANVLSGIHKIC